MTPPSKGNKLLQGRYKLVRALTSSPLAWVAESVTEDYAPFIVRTWSYESEVPDEFQRALWDSELRVLYRLSSSPGADRYVVTLHDAGIDNKAQAFVMVLKAPGTDTLSTFVEAKRRPEWLRDLKQPTARSEFWRCAMRLVRAIELLHQQQVVHRNVSLANVFLEAGAESLWETIRLGGFEWSTRVGATGRGKGRDPWAVPPEVLSGAAYTYSSDWYGLGTALLRTLIPGRGILANSADAVAQALRQLERSLHVTGIERDILQRMVDIDPLARLTEPGEIVQRMGEVVRQLERGTQSSGGRLWLVVNSRDTNLVHDLRELGFQPNPSDPTDPFSPMNAVHIRGLKDFVLDLLGESPMLFPTRQREAWLLGGDRCVFLIRKNKSHATGRSSWDAAFVQHVAAVAGVDDEQPETSLAQIAIEVTTVGDWNRKSLRQAADLNWDTFFPPQPDLSRLIPEDEAASFLDFVRWTNQWELVIRAGEVFRYTTLPHDEPTDSLFDYRLVRQAEISDDWVPTRIYVQGGLVSHLERALHTQEQGADLVDLAPLELGRFGRRRLRHHDYWEIIGVSNPTDVRPGALPATILLRRAKRENAPLAPQNGFLRTFGLNGQIALFERRQKAVSRLADHGYLGRAIAMPGSVFIDTRVELSPRALKLIHLARLDASKVEAISQIMRTRPIFVLQGPPGTGKTTLVAHLLRVILDEDPVAQVLVTAQSHRAVDVLRSKVEKEAFQDVPADDRPLSVRIGSRTRNGNEVEQETLRVLQTARGRLPEPAERSEIQNDWASEIDSLLAQPDALKASAGDLVELVRRAASITYTTTSSGDLEMLAAGDQTFDWTIIEEAAQSHGFDLALPMHAGHRWLLIGDQKQLSPYRIESYRDAIDTIDDSIRAIKGLRVEQPAFVDHEWLERWSGWGEDRRRKFVEHSRLWLDTFDRAYRLCRGIGGPNNGPKTPTAAGCLTGQFRMHPNIGSIVSKLFYDQELQNMTAVDGIPDASVVHELCQPKSVVGVPICWVVTPWAARAPRFSESGHFKGSPRYTNEAEAEVVRKVVCSLELKTGAKAATVAVLSPYAKQVSLLRQKLHDVELRTGLSWSRSKHASTEADEADGPGVYTVDSFQGNQASIVILSLVRNNSFPVGNAFGFLEVPSRLNVMISRAEQLLIVVGSWEFFWRHVGLLDPEDRVDRLNPLLYWKKFCEEISALVQIRGAVIVAEEAVDV